MTGVGVSWSAPSSVRQNDRDYSELIRKKAVTVTKHDKKRDGKYSVKEAIEAIHEAFHSCNGFDTYDGSKLDPELLEYSFSKNIILTFPTSLLAIMKGLAMTIQQTETAKNIGQIQAQAVELHLGLPARATPLWF